VRARSIFRGRDGDDASSKQGAAWGASGKPRYVLRSVDSFFEDRFGEVIPRRFASSSHVLRAADLGKRKLAPIAGNHSGQILVVSSAKSKSVGSSHTPGHKPKSPKTPGFT
jgi:hypothetical protein